MRSFALLFNQIVIGTFLCLYVCCCSASRSFAATTDRIIAKLGTSKGICLVASSQPTELPFEVVRSTDMTVYFQSDNEEVVATLQRQAAATGLLGNRVYAEYGPLHQIHLATNLADAAIFVADSLGDAVRDELLRVTHPGARIVTKDSTTITNQRPDGSDDWSHPYHGPDNNPQSTDLHSQGPFLTQFLAEPWYVPMPQVTVASGGRVFKAFGHIALKEREWPWLNKLVAINGYNGTLLWKRDLTPGFMIHRSTMVAMPAVLYIADDQSCKVINATSGDLQREIKIPSTVDQDGVWKWMALSDGTLYALVGPPEKLDTVVRGGRTQAGWPWKDLGVGYASKYAWGFGRTLLAIDPATHDILWSQQWDEPIDSRAMCMANGKIFAYSHQKFLTAIDAKSGNPLWNTTDKKLLDAIGQHDRAQTASKGFASTAYAKANDKGIYFAGPQRTNLVAASAKDGSLMWSHPHGNFQLVLREDGLYAMGRMETSKVFDYLSGKIIADLECYRGNCTRATATPNSIFTRGYRHTGTMRLDLSGTTPRRIPLMRPACQDGVIIADGQLYWGPWMCDCNHSLIGMISLAPRNDVDIDAKPTNETRLSRVPSPLGEKVRTRGRQEDELSANDWPSYRNDITRSSASRSTIPSKATTRWKFESTSSVEPTAPIVAGNTAYSSGLDGIVRAVNVEQGKSVWQAFTGGAVRFPPEFADGCVYVGSGDGYVYCFDAATGETVWRFRAAPVDRKIAVHGRLLSNWPVGSGVLVEDGVVYAAAGITSYDGTHVYALDAKTGELLWHNGTSSALAGSETVAGVSVQGHLLMHDDRLYLAGGNVVSPAIYDPKDGRCLNELKSEWWEGLPDAKVRFPPGADSKMFNRSPRGRELFIVDGEVKVFDQLLYSPPKYGPSRYFGGHFLQAGSGKRVVRGTTNRVVRLSDEKTDTGQPIGVWRTNHFRDPTAIAVCENAVVVAGELAPDENATTSAPRYALTALNFRDGKVLWSEELSTAPVPWGLAIDRHGRSIVTLIDGSIVCIGKP